MAAEECKDPAQDSSGRYVSQRRHQILLALRSIFMTVYELDYTDMTAVEVHRDVGTSSILGDKTPLMVGYQISIEQLVHPDDVALYDRVYRPDLVKAYFEGTDNDSIWSELRMKTTESDYHWVRTGLVRLDNDEGHLLFIACSKDIQEERMVRETAEQLRFKEMQNAVMERILKNIPAGIFIFSLDGGYDVRYANDASYAILGIGTGDIARFVQRTSEYLDPQVLSAISAESALGKAISLHTLRTVREDGQECWISASIVPGVDDTTGERLFYCAALDDTEQVAIEQAFNRQTDLYRMAIDNTDDVIYEYDIPTDTMRVVGTRLLSKGVLDVMEGFCEHLGTSGLVPIESAPRIAEALRNPPQAGVVARSDMLLNLACDQMQWWRNQYKTAFDDEGRPERVIGILREIGEERRLQSELAAQIENTRGLEQLATTDALTGLLNRAEFKRQADAALNRPNPTATFFILDLDEFKSVNDTLGHQAGDELLGRVGYILKHLFRAGDLVGRLGGDEFVIFIPGTDSVEKAASRAQAIKESVARLRRQVCPGVALGVSIGIAFVPKDGLDFETIYAAGDAALYEAKKHGKGRYVIA